MKSFDFIWTHWRDDHWKVKFDGSRKNFSKDENCKEEFIELPRKQQWVCGWSSMKSKKVWFNLTDCF